MRSTISNPFFHDFDSVSNNFFGIDFLHFIGSKFSTDSVQNNVDVIKEDLIESTFLSLKQDIGSELYSKLTYEDRIFMVETAGSVDLGKRVDLYQIYRDIENYEP